MNSNILNRNLNIDLENLIPSLLNSNSNNSINNIPTSLSNNDNINNQYIRNIVREEIGHYIENSIIHQVKLLRQYPLLINNSISDISNIYTQLDNNINLPQSSNNINLPTTSNSNTNSYSNYTQQSHSNLNRSNINNPVNMVITRLEGDIEGEGISAIRNIFNNLNNISSNLDNENYTQDFEDVSIAPSISTLREATTIFISRNNDNNCTICLQSIQDNEICRKINKCRHFFHSDCIEKWFEKNIKCPMCRQDLRDTNNISNNNESTNNPISNNPVSNEVDLITNIEDEN